MKALIGFLTIFAILWKVMPLAACALWLVVLLAAFVQGMVLTVQN